MCAVSYMGDFYKKKIEGDWQREYPWIYPVVYPNTNPTPAEKTSPYIGVSRQEFDELKKKVEEMRDILLTAKEYDEKTNQPHCEHEDKVALLKKLAESLGVDLKDVFE